MINNKAQIDRMNEQLDDLLGPKSTDEMVTIEMMEAMEVGDQLEVSYKFKEFGMTKERTLVIEAYESGLSVVAKNNLFGSMNVEKVTGTRLKAYSYDLMSQRTTYDFKFSQMAVQDLNFGL